MVAPDRQRFVRRDRLKWAALGFLQGIIPVLVAAGLLLNLPFNVWLLGCATVLIGWGVAHWPKMSNAVDIIEVQGATIRFQRFWTRCWVEVMQETISHVGMARTDKRIVVPDQEDRPTSNPISHVADSRIRAGTASEFEFLCSDYQLEVSGKPRLARLLLTGYAGYFLKIQVTANVVRPSFPALCDAAVKAIEELLQAPLRQIPNVGQRAGPGEASRV